MAPPKSTVEYYLPKANIHYYFSSKEQLYQKVLFEICLAWEIPADRFDEDSNPKASIKRLIEAKIDMANQRPYESKVWASEILRGAPIIQDFIRYHLDRLLTQPFKIVSSL